MNDYKPLESFDNNFGISKEGKVKNFQTGRILSSYIGVDMYEHIVICYQGKRYRRRVHRLMAEAYFNNCSVIDHIDGNKSNNNIYNLQPITHSENIKKAYQENNYINPHKGRGIWIIAEDKETSETFHFRSLRQCEKYTGIDRHRIKHFLLNERTNLTKYNFYYDE